MISLQYSILKIYFLQFAGKLEDASCALSNVSPDLLSYPAILQLRVALLLATNQPNVCSFVICSLHLCQYPVENLVSIKVTDIYWL